MKIYTKTGDDGTTGLLSGTRRLKNDDVIETLGTLDELSAHLGMAASYPTAGSAALREQIQQIQSWLLDAGAAVAAQPRGGDDATPFEVDTETPLEQWIDWMDDKLPQLTNFILPGGGLAASTLHVARSVARRCERRLVTLAELKCIDQSLVRFLNRLSDYLFVAARFAAQIEEQPEVLYVKHQRVPRN